MYTSYLCFKKIRKEKASRAKLCRAKLCYRLDSKNNTKWKENPTLDAKFTPPPSTCIVLGEETTFICYSNNLSIGIEENIPKTS